MSLPTYYISLIGRDVAPEFTTQNKVLTLNVANEFFAWFLIPDNHINL